MSQGSHMTAVRIRVWILLAAIFAAATVASASAPADLASDSAIRQILVQRIDVYHQSVGIVVGIIDSHGRRVVAYGHLNQSDPRPLNGNTIFEIGSITKVFTSLALSKMAQKDEVDLDDPVVTYLPPGASVPQLDGRQITLAELAMHTSGLPRLPTNLHPKDPANPYADYSAKDLLAFLASYHLTRDPGSKFEYSNLGAGLLGFALARRAGMDYGSLVQSLITELLGMSSTGVTLSPEEKERLAVGHDASLAPVPNWDFEALAGCGALKSTANDLLTFLAANLGFKKTPLDRAMSAMLRAPRATGTSGLEIGLGWLISTRARREIVWHNGGTFGYRSFIGFVPKAKLGVVVLSNTFTAEGVDNIGIHLLNPQIPLMRPPAQHHEITLAPQTLERYVGRYQLAPSFLITVNRQGDHLYAQATGQPRFEIYPEGQQEFFYKVVDAQIDFVLDGSGHATGLMLHQNGQNVRGKRMPKGS